MGIPLALGHVPTASADPQVLSAFTRKCLTSFADLLQPHGDTRNIGGKELQIARRTRGDDSVEYMFDREKNGAVHAYNVSTTSPGYAAEAIDESFTAWSRVGTRKLIEISESRGGAFSAQKTLSPSGHERTVFAIDTVGDRSRGALRVQRVHELPGEKTAFDFPRIEVRVETTKSEKSITVVLGRANGRVEGDVAIVDDRVSHGLGLEMKIPTLTKGSISIDATGLGKMKRLTDGTGDERSDVFKMAMDLIKTLAPDKTIVLNALDGRYYKLPNESTWNRMN